MHRIYIAWRRRGREMRSHGTIRRLRNARRLRTPQGEEKRYTERKVVPQRYVELTQKGGRRNTTNPNADTLWQSTAAASLPTDR
jgi:hypothetical protein